MINNIKEYWLRLDKINKFFILFLVFSFIIRIISLTYSPIRGWDETVYLNLGYDLSLNPFFYSLENSGWNDYIPSSDPLYGWPNIGFRAPLLPYILSSFYFFNLDFLIPFIIPFFTTMSVLLVYILGKNIFNKQVGFYGAVFFSLIPINISTSEKIWTDPLVVFFLLTTFIAFWKGYEENINKYKILFGLFLGLSLLTRYTTLWITPVFLLYFLIRDRSFKFMFDKYIWKAILLFFITILPWLIYGFKFYQNPLGGFIHGFKASAYWGGVQAWNYFIYNSWLIFSVIGILFLLSLIYVFYKREFKYRGMYLLLIWGFIFYFIVIAMPHKEERFITPIIPVICLISAFFINKQGKYKNVIFGFIVVILLFSTWKGFKLEYLISQNKSNICFSDGNNYLASDFIEKDSIIMTNQSTMVHYYTGKKIILYPEELNINKIKNIINLNYNNKTVYMYFASYDMPKENDFKNNLNENFKKVFECSKDYGYSAIYKYE